MGGTTRTPKSLTPLRPAVAAEGQGGRIDVPAGGRTASVSDASSLGVLYHSSPFSEGFPHSEWVHVGTRKAAEDRARMLHPGEFHLPDDTPVTMHALRLSGPVYPRVMHEEDVHLIQSVHPSDLNHLADEGEPSWAGYKVYPYDNQTEDKGAVSYLAHRSAITSVGRETIPRTASRWQPSSGIFGPTTGLDQTLFDENGSLRPGVAHDVMTRLDQCIRVDSGLAGSDWQGWTRVYLLGGSVSEWAGSRPNETARDLDVIVAIDLDAAHGCSAFEGMNAGEAASALNAAFWKRFNADGWKPSFGGTWNLTAFCNQRAWDVAVIKPYAAYDLTHGRWAVKPPHLPEHSAADFDPAVMRFASAVAAEARAVLKLPEPERTREATALWQRLHADRDTAFSEHGSGWGDIGNLTEKYLAYAPRHLLDKVKELVLAPKTAVAGRTPGRVVMMHPRDLMQYVETYRTDDEGGRRHRRDLADSFRQHGYDTELHGGMSGDKHYFPISEPIELVHEDQASYFLEGNHRVHALNDADWDEPVPVLVKDRRTPKTAAQEHPAKTKEQVNYRHATSGKHCGNCTMIRDTASGGHRCTLVKGSIDPADVCDEWYSGKAKTAAWDSSGSDNHGVYLRFGDWPHDERSYSPAGGYKEEGVSVYDLDREGDPSIDNGLDRRSPWHHEHDRHCGEDCDLADYNDEDTPGNDPREEMQGRKARAEKDRHYGSDRDDSVGHLVRGEVSGVGYDGEPLLKDVRRIGDWIDHRHLFLDQAGPHRLARDPSDEDYEEPEEKPPYGYRNRTASLDSPSWANEPPGDIDEGTATYGQMEIEHPDDTPWHDEEAMSHGRFERGTVHPDAELSTVQSWLTKENLDWIDQHRDKLYDESEPVEILRDHATGRDIVLNGNHKLTVARERDLRRPMPAKYVHVNEDHRTAAVAQTAAGMPLAPWMQWAGDEPHKAVINRAQGNFREEHPEFTRPLDGTDWSDPDASYFRRAQDSREGTGAMRKILGAAGHPDAGRAWTGLHPDPKGSSQVAIDPQTGALGAVLLPDRWDLGTVAHEAAHLVHAHQTGIDLAAMAHGDHEDGEVATGIPDHVMHGPEFARHYANALDVLSPGAGDDFLRHRQNAVGLVGNVRARFHKLPKEFEGGEPIRREATAGDYRQPHQGPDADDGEALHELGSRGLFPPDVYDRPDDYGGDPATWQKMRDARGDPDRRVVMYRAMPAPHHKINPGDWVTLSKDYAIQHAQESGGDHYAVLKKQVRAGELRNDGNDLHEWTYHGPVQHFPGLEYRGGATNGWRNLRALQKAQESDQPQEWKDADAETARQDRAVDRSRKRDEASAMVYLHVPPGTLRAPQGGEAHHHVTLAYLPKGMTDEDFDRISSHVEGIAARHAPFKGTFGGHGTFPEGADRFQKRTSYVPLHAPAAHALHADLTHLSRAKYEGFSPHATLAYLRPGDRDPEPHPEASVPFTHVHVRRGDEVRSYPLTGRQHTAAASQEVYLRFGHWPEDERSQNYVTRKKEGGVSAYRLDEDGDPEDPNPDSEPEELEEMQRRVHRAERNRMNGQDHPRETGHLVTGREVGEGHDGEPLLKDVRRVGDWIDHRHLFIDTAEPHDLAREPGDEGYEPPGEPHALTVPRATKKRGTAATGYTDLKPRSGMIYLDLPPGTVRQVPGGVDDHHVTICYLGKDVSDEAFEEACRRTREAAARLAPMDGVLRGIDIFPPSRSSDGKVVAFVPAYVGCIGLLRRALEDLSASEHRDYQPHVTLAYLEEGDSLPAPHPAVPLRFTQVHVKRGDDVRSFPLAGGLRKGAAYEDATDEARAQRRRRVDRYLEDRENRSGTMYIPGRWAEQVHNSHIHDLMDEHSGGSFPVEHWEHLPDQEVSLRQKIHQHQGFVYPEGVREKVRQDFEDDDPWAYEGDYEAGGSDPKFVRHEGETYLVDGHHRFARARLMGHGSMWGKVFDTANPDHHPRNCYECNEGRDEDEEW